MHHPLKKPFKAIPLLSLVLSLGLLSGCLDEKKTNTDSASYTPETRTLGVIAGEGAEYTQGSQVNLSGRLVGTVTDQTVLWEQIEGDPIPGITSWTTPTLSFVAPTVDGLKSYKFQISARDKSGAIVKDAAGNPLVDQVAIVVYDPSVLVTLEVEDTNFATLKGGATLVSLGDNNYINGATGKHTADITPGANATYSIPSGSTIGDKILKPGFYTLYVQYAIPTAYGGKVGEVNVNGVVSQMQFNASGAWEKYRVGTIKLNEGANSIEIGGGWNYYRIDSISLIPAPAPAKPLAVAATLSNPNATAATQDLMTFLVSNYGAKTLSGQTEYINYGSNKTGLRDFDKVVSITGGDAPAITAFDFIDYSSSRVACGANHGTLTEDMIAAHKTKNVILAPLWHWNSPTKLKDTNCSGSGDTAWYSGFYSTATNFDLKAALANPNGADYQALLADIDTISVELKKLSDANIPVLWRPLHEAQGAWFWWGKSGPDELKALWKLMYERMTTTHGLNNLIWVFTYSDTASAAWYPGDNYVDIVGYDGYDGKNAGNPFKSQFSTIKDRHDGKKLVGLTETGTIPNIETMHKENAWWAFFITWNSDNSSDYGPANADPAILKASYAYKDTLNLDDVPGGRTKIEAGSYTGFESSTAGFAAQIGWANTTGLSTSNTWASSGTTSLVLAKNLVTQGSASDIVFQNYPEGGLDVSGMTTLTIKVKATGAGSNVNAHIFWKSGATESWPAAVAVAAEGTTLSIPLTVDKLDGFGVRFNGVDATSTDARFYIDEITLSSASSSKVIYDFEPATSDFSAQIGWSNTGGITTSTEWAKTGARSLALYKNLVTQGSASDIVFQTYPEKGLDVKGKSTLTIAAHALGAGSAVNAHIFWKSGATESWPSAVAVTANGVELSIDVSEVDSLSGFGVRFNGVDATSTNARFFIDSIKLDGKIIYDFEGADAWEFQVNWSGTPGIQLASDWSKTGQFSLAGVTQLKNGDDNIILQTYPAGGLLLGDVSTLKISAHAKDTGSATQAMLFAKDKNGNWKDGGATPLVNGSVDLSLDISAWDELSGFGVRFMGPVNSATESKFYIDDVTFE